MKKNITINLCGRLFNIDEDAYELLKNYMDTLHNYFKNQKGGEEIANDIEERIAELLEELKAKGTEAINIEHIKDVINRIGQPEQMDDNQEEMKEDYQEQAYFSTSEEEKTPRGIDKLKDFIKHKRFYRNPKDKMLAGVISGFASTFEVDVTILRMIVVVVAILASAIRYPNFLFINLHPLLFIIITYCILAAIMPEAETPEQQLKMQGKPINMSNLANEVVQNVSEATQKIKPAHGAKSILNTIMKFLTGCMKALLVILAIGLFFMGAIIVVWAILTYVSPNNINYFFDWNTIPIFNESLGTFNVFVVAIVMSLLIPAYVIIYCLTNRMSVMQRISWLLIWLIALATSIMTGITLTKISDEYKYQKYYESRLKDGVFMSEEDKEYLELNNWNVVMCMNCDRFTAKGQHYSGDKEIQYLDDWEDRARMRMKVEQSQIVEPGKYRLTAVVRAENKGPILYAKVHGRNYQIDFPITGNEGGSVWEDACNTDLNAINGKKNDNDATIRKTEIENIRNANDGKGFGWTRIAIEDIIVRGTAKVTFGISTNTGKMRAKWFSACDVELERIGD